MSNDESSTGSRQSYVQVAKPAMTIVGTTIPAAREVGRKRIIDETKLGPEDARKLENQRAYNRLSAAKARKRTKNTIENLQKQIEDLTEERNEMKRELDIGKAQLELLQRQNQNLILNQGWTAPQRQSIALLPATSLGYRNIGFAGLPVIVGNRHHLNNASTMPTEELFAFQGRNIATNNAPANEADKTKSKFDSLSNDLLTTEYQHHRLESPPDQAQSSGFE